MTDYVFTFGSSQLSDFNVKPLNTLICVQAYTETAAREEVFAFDGIGMDFCTSYERSNLPLIFKSAKYAQLTLKDLNNARINVN